MTSNRRVSTEAVFTRLPRIALAAGIAVCMSLSASTAKADTIMASLFTALAPSGSTPTVVDLTGITTPSQATVNGAGFTVTFAPAIANQGVVQGDLPNMHAVPVAGVTGGNPEYLTGNFGSALTTNINNSGNYLSTALGTITITFATPQTSLALLWGSIDTLNQLTFNDAAHFVVTGAAVQTAAMGFVSNGFQGPGGSAYVVIDTDTPFTTVTATSGNVSFEFAGVAGSAIPFVSSPEPGTLGLLGIGLGLITIGGRKLRFNK